MNISFAIDEVRGLAYDLTDAIQQPLCSMVPSWDESRNLEVRDRLQSILDKCKDISNAIPEKHSERKDALRALRDLHKACKEMIAWARATITGWAGKQPDYQLFNNATIDFGAHRWRVDRAREELWMAAQSLTLTSTTIQQTDGANHAQVSTACNQQEADQAEENKGNRRRGRKQGYDEKVDQKLCEDWEAAKRQGQTRESFTRARGYTVNDLIAAQDRMKYRRTRDAE